ALLGVDADGLPRAVGEGAVAVVEEEAVGAEVAGHIEVVVAVPVGVGVAEVERPAGEGDAGLAGGVGEATAAVVAPEGEAAAVLGRLEALREEARRLRLEDVDPLEVAADEQVEIAVA